VSFAALGPYGWGDRWAALMTEVVDGSGGPGGGLDGSNGSDDARGGEGPPMVPGRVVRHEGTAVAVALPTGVESRPLRRGLDPAPVVGDWVVERGGALVAVLPRASLLERRAVRRDEPQALAANVDVVLVTCGVDRPVKDGRIRRTATLAWDAGAVPAVVLTKVDTLAEGEIASLADEVAAANPGLDVVVTSATTGRGIGELRALVARPLGAGGAGGAVAGPSTVGGWGTGGSPAAVGAAAGATIVLLGESGAGKSSLVNALLGDEATAVGTVRHGDAKGRHTTTTRELHLVPGVGTIIDTPGIRSVGLWGDTDAVATTFDDIDDLALECRFSDCAHAAEPGCAVLAAVDAGRLSGDRLASWRALEREAAAAERRADPAAQRRHGKAFARVTKDAQRRKRR